MSAFTRPLVVAVFASLGWVPAAMAQKAEVIHWWASGGESAAVKQLAEAYNKAGGQWIDNAIAGGDNARAAALNRIAGGNPPTASQFNTSKQYHELIEAGLLNNVDEVAAKEGWDQWMPAPIKNVVKVKGHYYAVPINIHSAAWFWYSKAVLAKAGVSEPKTEAEFWTALDKIKASGQIAFAQSGTLSYERATFTTVLLHMGGRDLYMKFYGDKDATAVKSPEFRAVLEKFKKLRTYADPGSAGRNWNDTTALLVTDKAGFQTVGDWAKGEFFSAGKTAGKEFGCFAGWGPKAPYMVSGDVFVMPKTSNKEAIAAQQLLAKVVTSPATQVAFNAKKGSIPIRPDVDTSGLDVCAQAGVIALKDPARQTPDPTMLMAPDVYGKVGDVITKVWNTDLKPEDAQKQLAAAISAN
ncbi:MAG: ABC transporter substrate-binding protein [Rhizobacter sp.]